MRNLKRVLSLALALVMMLGMMIVGASAASAKDFPDAAEIDYEEAVDVISGLGIMIGDDKGNFNPDLVLTREQAAKIICYVIMGAENAEKLGNNTQIFNDVAAGRWSAGYIAYCANLGILAGYGNGNFGPEDKLTGVQFGKLLLVAAGYNAETQGYLGNDWATNIATDMIANGLDVKGVVLSDELTREQAAQMLLQALDMETVTYTTGNVVGMIGPFPAEETFAEKYFPKLDKFEGVVTANEYADLYGDTPLKAGKTEIGGKTYNGTTALTDIGETRRGWANDKDILYIDSKDVDGKDLNTVFQTGAATDISTDKKFEKATSLKATNDTEKFLNFGQGSTYSCEYLLTFSYYDENNDIQWHEVKKNTALTAAQYADLQDVFDDNALAVYVGTKSTQDEGEDKSDSLTWKQFKDKYLEEDLTAAVGATVNGEWLKVIDNDNDGKADYVLKTEFFIDKVYDISKKGEITLVNNGEAGRNEAYVAYDDIAEGDVVIATALIDGNYYLTEAETFQGVVTTVSYKNESITVDGDEYFQSEIDSDAYVAALDMFEDIQVADEKTEYVFYTDLFGYVRAYTYVDATTTYGLLTEAYVDNYFNGKYVKKNVGIAEVTIGDAKTAEYIVTNLGTATKNPNPFFTNVDNVGADAELVPALSTTAGDTVTSTTNIAKYSGLTEDEITLKSAEQRGTGLKTLEIVELKNNVDISAKARSYDAVNDKYVSANKDTEYYFVYVDHNIAYRVGYSEVPAMKAANITAAYALTQVTTNDSTATKEYGVAKVIVFETNANVVRSAADTILGYYNTSKTTSKVQAIDSILGAGTLSTVYEDNTWYDSKFDEIAFYDTYAGKNENVTLDKITRNFASYRIYAGQIDRIEGLDYIKVDQTTAGATLDLDLTETKAPVYVLNNSKKDVVTAEEITLTAKKNTGDEIIWVENKKGEVIYVVDVTKSIDAATDATFTDIKDLYNDIIADGVVAPTPAPLYDQLVAKFNALDKTDPAKVSALKAEITAADTSSMKGSEIADLNNKAAYLGNLETAQAAVAAAANGYGKGTLGWSDEAAAAAIDAGYEDLAALAASDLVGFDTTLNTGAAAGVWSTMTAAATQVDGDAAAAVAAADAALTAIKTALNGKTATTATVTDASVESFKAAIDAAVAAMVTDPKASVSVSDYGDVATQVASLGTAGNITVTGVKITLSYQGASSTQGQDLGAITVPYNML